MYLIKFIPGNSVYIDVKYFVWKGQKLILIFLNFLSRHKQKCTFPEKKRIMNSAHFIVTFSYLHRMVPFWREFMELHRALLNT